MSIEPALIDKIYEAAIVPELWPKVCQDLARVPNAYGTSVINISPEGSVRFVTTPNLEETLREFSQSTLPNVRPGRHLELMPFSFVRDVDAMTEEEIANDPIYNTFMRPRGLGWSMGDVLIEPSGQMIIFDVMGETARGPFTAEECQRMNLLKPDLSRAALMSSRLAFQQAQGMTEALSALGLPSAVLSDGGKLVAANPEFEALAPRIKTGAENRIVLSGSAAHAMLDEAIGHLKSGSKLRFQSIPMAATEDAPALIIHLVPVKKSARDIFSRSAAILLVTPVGEVGPPDVRVLCGLFDLTSAEARIARELSMGTSLEVCALRLGITRETVRTYIKRIFTKTGTSRQAELTALLSGIGTVKL